MDVGGEKESRYLQSRNFAVKRRKIMQKLEGEMGTSDGKAVEREEN